MVVTTKAPEVNVPGTGLDVDCPSCLTTNLGWLLSQAYYAFASEQGSVLAPLEISPRAYCVLSSALTAERTQTELAQLTGLDKTTMVVTLDELEEAGLAERKPSATDRRARVVAVTKKGERRVAEAQKLLTKVQSDVLETLSGREREAFVAALNKLVRERLSHPVEGGPPMRRRAPAP
jgi:MarR family transcriptional regulator for hemolysin